jgi:restriction endonuclease Mrr
MHERGKLRIAAKADIPSSPESSKVMAPGYRHLVMVRRRWAFHRDSLRQVCKPLVGGAGDGGVDGIIDQDHLGLDRIYVQAKRYAEGNTVGSGAIRVSSAV